MKEWYRCEPKEVLRELQTGEKGLTEAQVQERRKRYGENRLRESKRKPAWAVFLEQFKDLLVMILIGAALISMLTDNVESTVVIFAVITLNAVLGTIQHEKAEKSLESLRAMAAPSARVLRDGVRKEIPSAQVVPGDILCLEAGDLVVADGRVLTEASLQVNESSLTGESAAVEKSAGPLRGQVPLAERSSMVYSGALVTGGVGTAVVTATGMNTEIGTIARLMDSAKERKTPLQISLDQFGSRLAAVIMIICLAVFGLEVYRGEAILDSLMFAVALAVAAIPEALGSIVTVVQAMGTQKMARERAIMKDLKAVESLGCVSVICTDKTGTLTQNRMKVEQVVLDGRIMEREEIVPSSRSHRFFLEACALANDAERGVGDATELALLELVQSCGLSPETIRGRHPRLRQIPFDSERKRMSSVNLSEGEEVLFCKGAADVLLERCDRLSEGGAVRKMTASEKRKLIKLGTACSAEGLRVLGLAWQPIGKENGEPEKNMIFLGMAAMADPPREESARAVADARRAGICPVMITGDHKITAVAIARKVGILRPDGEDGGRKVWEENAWGEKAGKKKDGGEETAADIGELAVSGRELDAMTAAELSDKLERIRVYARVTPEHKLRIVKAWQDKGKIVAMTGDGVNDAPALRQADIGVAMGITGTEVSKDAADMILADDNFATIIKAVANGRNVYRNIRNAIQFLLSGNIAGIFCVLYTTFRGLPLPFAPVHLLFINLLTDSLPALAIGMEQPEPGLLELPPRDPDKGILSGRVLGSVLLQGGLIALCTMWAYGIGLSGGSAGCASTMAFATLTLARLFHGFNCRSRSSLARIGVFSNRYTVLAFLAGTLLLGMALFVPALQVMFAAADLDLARVGAMGILAFLPTVLIQAGRMLREC